MHSLIVVSLQSSSFPDQYLTLVELVSENPNRLATARYFRQVRNWRALNILANFVSIMKNMEALAHLYPPYRV